MRFELNSVFKFVVNVFEYLNELGRILIAGNIIEIKRNEIALLSILLHIEVNGDLFMVGIREGKFKGVFLIRVLREQNRNIIRSL